MVLAFGLRRRGRNLLFLASAGFGFASVVLVVLLFGLGPGTSFIGTIQRLVLAAFYGWIVFVSTQLGALRRQGREGDETA
jgi:hypothetical protein